LEPSSFLPLRLRFIREWAWQLVQRDPAYFLFGSLLEPYFLHQTGETLDEVLSEDLNDIKRYEIVLGLVVYRHEAKLLPCLLH
jgi:hypothetical protein